MSCLISIKDLRFAMVLGEEDFLNRCINFVRLRGSSKVPLRIRSEDEGNGSTDGGQLRYGRKKQAKGLRDKGDGEGRVG